ncbi:MAG: alpha-2-macroglobulin family protein, partial [Planctomycetota bacterium]
MVKKAKIVAVVIVVLAMGLSAFVADCKDTVSVVVLTPKTLYAGNPVTVSATAVTVADQSPAVVNVAVWFRTDASTASQVFEGVTDECGRLTARFDTPDVTPGQYTLEIEAEGVEKVLTAQVQVHRLPVLLIETDKPIYKPGQTIQARVLVLTNELRPASSEVNVEITDGKGIKIFRKSLTTNAFGVAPFKLDLASELNFGTWKITADSGSASGTVDVRVEKYVLPRFEVELVTTQDYFLVDQEISGTVNANYFFGKPVDGNIEVRAKRYVGVWEEYATYTATLSGGSADFLLPAVGYVSGTPGAGGAGSAQLEVVVTDTSGHEEETTKLLKIVDSTIQHRLIALSQSITPGRPFDVLLVAETPDGQPTTVSAEVTCEYLDEWRPVGPPGGSWPPSGGWPPVKGPAPVALGKVRLNPSANDKYYSELATEDHLDFNGSAIVSFLAPEGTAYARIRSSVSANGDSADAELTIYAAYSPSDSFLHLRRVSDAPIHVGDIVTVDVFQTHDATVYYDVFANGRTVWSDATTATQIVFQATQQMVPAARVVAYAINPNNEVSAHALPLEVAMDNEAELKVRFDAEQVLPGRLNMLEVFDELERRFMEPQAETHRSLYCAYDVFDKAGLQVLVSDTIDVPQGWRIWPSGGGGTTGGGTGGTGGGGGGGWPPNGGGGGWPPNGGGGPSQPPDDDDDPLAEVTRIRQFFPETWLWMPDLLTQPNGTAAIDLTAPDSITTWRLHAVSTSNNGLGIAESELLVFQEFFGEPDLPYAVTRGEQFPVRIQIFNYLDVPQLVHVELTDADWFDLLEDGTQQVLVNANSVGSASFLIQPNQLGRNTLEVTLRSALRADAVRKELLVEPEGTRRELVTNGMIRAGRAVTLDTAMPEYRVPGS